MAIVFFIRSITAIDLMHLNFDSRWAIMSFYSKLKSFSKIIWSEHFSISKIGKNPVQLKWKEEISAREHFKGHPGLNSIEESAVKKVFQLFPRQIKVLVLECGLGREAFALEKMGGQVVAIDHNLNLIERARKKANETGSQIQFYQWQWQEDKLPTGSTKFDIIYIGAGMPNYVYGRSNRVHFFNNLKDIMVNHTRIILTPDIQALEWKSLPWWASKILQIRWQKNGLWEEGDTGVCSDATGNESLIPSFYHLYPSPNHIHKELLDAGLSGRSLSNSPVWIAHKNLLKDQ